MTYAAVFNDRQVVVKVAPPGVRPIAHRDVLRQARILRALSQTAVPVPEVIFTDAGDPPEVPPLFAMSHLDGNAFEPLFDLEAAADAGSPHVVAERFRRAAATLANLHRIDPASLNLSPEQVAEPSAEVERWCRTLETVDPALAPGWREVAAALLTGTPTARPSAVVHGDFRLGNLLAVKDRITAVIDWEIWSIGDPRIDAGWFLINADPRTYRRATRYAAVVPPLPELAGIYHTESGCPLDDLDWFQALACFKSTATWSLIVKHNRRRTVPSAELAAMAPVLPRLLARAAELLG